MVVDILEVDILEVDILEVDILEVDILEVDIATERRWTSSLQRALASHLPIK
jgi:hypothetical protein